MAAISKKQGTQLGAAFALAAASSAVIAAGTPMLFPVESEMAAFQVFWSVLFFFSGILTGFNLEATRAISASQATANSVTPQKGPRVVWVAGAISLTLALLLAATAYWWGNLQFPSHGFSLALVVAFGVAVCGVYMATGGALAGRGNWGLYAGQISGYAGLQLVLVVTIALVLHSVVAAAIGTTLSFLVWIGFLLFSPNARAAASARTSATLRELLPQLGAAALASGASAALVIGLPALTSLIMPSSIVETEGPPLFLALTLTRAPLMIPLNAVQGVVIAHFSRRRAQGLHALWPIIRIALLVGILAVAAAWLLGPWLLNLIWGSSFVLSGPLLGVLTAGATALAVISLTGAVSQSMMLHRSFVIGWLAAVATAIALLFLPLTLSHRAALALCLGPLVGIAIHLIALRNQHRGAST